MFRTLVIFKKGQFFWNNKKINVDTAYRLYRKGAVFSNKCQTHFGIS